jgi:signal peptidase II
VHHVQGRRRSPLEVRRPLVWLLGTAAVTLGLDQATKALVRTALELGQTASVIPGFLEFVRVQNEGAAFGMLPGRRVLFLGVSVVMLAAVAVYWLRERPSKWPVVIPLGLVVGGAIGNLIDRAIVGEVTDFLAFSIFAPVFNIADSGICVGVTALVIWVLFGPQPGAGMSAEPVGDRAVADGAPDDAASADGDVSPRSGE